MPIRGIIGSDLMKVRPDWKIIDNPFATDDPIVVVPAIRPDVALFHAPEADRFGNVRIGRQTELATMAYAAKTTLVTVERISETSLLADENSAAGVLPALYVTRDRAGPARRVAARAVGRISSRRRRDRALRPHGQIGGRLCRLYGRFRAAPRGGGVSVAPGDSRAKS